MKIAEQAHYDLVLSLNFISYLFCKSMNTLLFLCSSLHKTSTKISHNKSTLMNVRQRVRPLPPVRTNMFPNNETNLKSPTIVQNYTLNSRLFPVRTDVLACDGKFREKAVGPIVLRYFHYLCIVLSTIISNFWILL